MEAAQSALTSGDGYKQFICFKDSTALQKRGEEGEREKEKKGGKKKHPNSFPPSFQFCMRPLNIALGGWGAQRHSILAYHDWPKGEVVGAKPLKTSFRDPESGSPSRAKLFPANGLPEPERVLGASFRKEPHWCVANPGLAGAPSGGGAPVAAQGPQGPWAWARGNPSTCDLGLAPIRTGLPSSGYWRPD